MTEPNEHTPYARAGEHVVPSVGDEAFHCPSCGVLARQLWTGIQTDSGVLTHQLGHVGRCSNCRELTIWLEFAPGDYRMVKPQAIGGPPPHPEMPQGVKDDYDEARSIVRQSPRGASALLRLAVQKLCADLGESGENINSDIGALVNKGLPVEVQQALDVVRVVGNNAVHPGELDLQDDVDTASALFNVINFIVQDRIAQPKAIATLYQALPQKSRDAVAERDQP